MCTTSHSQIPQGFSVYQAMLGSPLQFFPALGTKELDDMLDAYIPGPSSVAEKRATVSVEFFEYAQRTGQAFKFFAVPSWMTSPVDSPASLSPFQASASVSSVNVSPVTSTWDWSAVSGPTTSAHASKSSRAGSTTSSRHHAAADFSHIPGMKILTKDGLDVTNSASRGSKTKEQRDHAHLMRIIKACDSCKKKKIRCDPSHKKRSASAPQPAKVVKKSKAVKPAVSAPQPQVFQQPAVQDANSSFILPNVGTEDTMAQPWAASIDSEFAMPEFESVDIDNLTKEPWEDWIDFSAEAEPSYDFFSDPQGFLIPPDAQPTSVASSASSADFSWDDVSQQQSVSFTSSPSDGSDALFAQSDQLDQAQLQVAVSDLASRSSRQQPQDTQLPQGALQVQGHLQARATSSHISRSDVNERGVYHDDGSVIASQSRILPLLLSEHIPADTHIPSAGIARTFATQDAAPQEHAPHGQQDGQEIGRARLRSEAPEFSRWSEYQQFGEAAESWGRMPRNSESPQAEGGAPTTNVRSYAMTPAHGESTTTVAGRAPLSSSPLSRLLTESSRTQQTVIQSHETGLLSTMKTITSASTSTSMTALASAALTQTIQSLLSSYTCTMTGGKGRGKPSDKESWLGTLGKLAIIPLATSMVSSLFFG